MKALSGLGTSLFSVLILSFPAVCVPQAYADDTWRFDFGTADSPSAKGYASVTGQDAYESSRGYGWESAVQEGFATQTPSWDDETPSQKVGRGITLEAPLLYNQFADPLNRDGVSSTRPMTFRVDLPNGRYRVSVLVGDLTEPLGSLWLDANGRAVARNLSTKHYIWRTYPFGLGFFRWVRFNADVSNGKLQLRFYGNDEQYRKDKARMDELFPRNEHLQNLKRKQSYARGDPNPYREREHDFGGPFVRSSVLGLTVLPYSQPPLLWEGATLRAGRDQQGEWIGDFLESFHSGDFSRAVELLEAASNRGESSDAVAFGYLSLLGHPETREPYEESWIKEADQALAAFESDEIRQDLAYFARARRHFQERGMGREVDPVTGRTSYESHFLQLYRAAALWQQIGPDSPLYYNAQQYRMRALMMMDPHRWTFCSGEGFKIVPKLLEVWPENKYALYFEKGQWNRDEDWILGEYSADIPMDGAPEWARMLRAAHLMILDMTEWWHDHKLQPDGGIGGGWGDDVELIALWAVYGLLNPSASPKTVAVAERNLQGLWDSDEVDSEAGFVRFLTDAEHAAEWTGNTLNLMLNVRYGNPLWVERAMGTAKLMRNLFMAKTKLGRLHFKANYMGALNIDTGGKRGRGPRSNDSYINFCATRPAAAVHWYSGHPTIERLFVDWADGWLQDSMSEGRGKPRGVIPVEVGWPDNEIGGIDSPSWYEAYRPFGTVNIDFENLGYRDYIIQLFLMAHEMTGDDRFLEPLRLESELVRHYEGRIPRAPEPGTAAWAAYILSGHNKRNYNADEQWQRIQSRLTTAQGTTTGYSASDVIEGSEAVIENMEKLWPRLTTETSATDRIAFGEIGNPFYYMSGTVPSPSVIENLAITHEGLGRDAVARVALSNDQELRVVYYNFNPEPLRLDAALWRLTPGGTYRVVTRVDTDGDGLADRDVSRAKTVLENRGETVTLTLAPKTSTVLELTQLVAGDGVALKPDLAVVAEEIVYNTRWREVEVTLHNIGAVEAENFDVVFSTVDDQDQAEEIGRVHVSFLNWPLDFDPKTMRVGVRYLQKTAKVRYRVDVDPDDRLDEITERNNRAERLIELDPRKLLGRIVPDNY